MGPDKVNILLVDDEPANLLALEAILGDLGPNLVKARSGKEALRRLLNEDFALILMDVRMPEMDGLETAALIRQRERTRHVPIIFLTGYDRSDVQLFQGYSVGAVDFLTKPLVPEVLRSKVQVFVELARKTELLKRTQEREHAQRLLEEKQRWEMERLREEAARDKRVAEELGREVAERVRAEGLARERARQQALVAELGQRALAGANIAALLDEAAALVAKTLGVAHCVVLELLPDGETLLVRAGVGWKEGCLGRATLRATANGHGANGFLADEPVVFEDLPAEERFAGLGLMREHGVVSGMNVVIRGKERPFGVLGAHSSHKRAFSQDDVHFLQAVAHVLATAIERKRAEDEVAGLKDELAGQLADMTHLHRLSARLSATLELEAAQEEVLRAVVELQGANSGVLIVRDAEDGNLYPAASVGLPPDFRDRLGLLTANAGLYGASLARRHGVIVEDVEEDEDFASDLPTARALGFRAACATPLLRRGGEVIGAIVAHFSRPHCPSERDVRLVELYARQAAEALDNARLHRAIWEANEGKDEFLAMLAHELRNPLAPILNALHVMRLAKDPQAGEHARDMIERQTRHMARLVDDLLDVSRITRGKIQLRMEPADLTAIVQAAIEGTRPLILARGHQIEVEVPAEPVRLLADATRLEQVLANLLTNAAKYTEPSGRIWVKVRCEGAQVVVSVRDTGLGIAPHLLPRVFDLFMQAHATLDRALGGLGIGLTLVRRLVEMHGGSVEARSEGVGKGSEFTVRLPALEQSAAEPAEVLPPVAPSQRRPRRVLVVDDNRDAAESLTMMLRLDGHEVHVAHSGPVALETARLHPPEVVLLDIGLPGMTGYEVAPRLLDQAGPDAMLLVAMTGYGQEEDRRRSREAGFAHHLVKPVDPQLLRELLAHG